MDDRRKSVEHQRKINENQEPDKRNHGKEARINDGNRRRFKKSQETLRTVKKTQEKAKFYKTIKTRTVKETWININKMFLIFVNS